MEHVGNRVASAPLSKGRAGAGAVLAFQAGSASPTACNVAVSTVKSQTDKKERVTKCDSKKTSLKYISKKNGVGVCQTAIAGKFPFCQVYFLGVFDPPAENTTMKKMHTGSAIAGRHKARWPVGDSERLLCDEETLT